MDRPSRALVGIALVVAATACFGALDTITKVVSTSGVSVAMALWVRFSVQVVATALTTLPTRGWSALHTAHPRFQLLRGLLLLTCSMLAYFSLRFLPVGEFTAIIMIGPLVITVMAVIVLKGRVSLLRWVLGVGAFVGTLIIIRPGGDSFTWAMLLAMALGVRESVHVRMDMLVDAFPEALRRYFDQPASLLIMALGACLAWALGSVNPVLWLPVCAAPARRPGDTFSGPRTWACAFQ